MTSIRCIVLPGMDGTGELLSDFAASLAPELDTQVIAYPRDRPMGYDALTQWTAERLPDTPYVLVGESFSGPIAIRLAAQRPPLLHGVVLCATFARAPRPPWLPLPPSWLAQVAGLMPLHRLPASLAAAFMLGRWADREWTARTGAVLRSLDPDVIRLRMREGGNADERHRLASIARPLLYLRGRQDRLVSIRSLHELRAAMPNATVVEMNGPHFLLQARHRECAAEIKRWLAAITD